MNSYNVDQFPSVFLTADTVVIHNRRVLLIQRKKDPYQNFWALPGGFFDVPTDLNIVSAAARELFEETNLKASVEDFKLVGIFSEKNRDPRDAIATKKTRIVSAAYLLLTSETDQLKAKDDAKAVQWFDIEALPNLAFDHAEIIKAALKLS